MLIPVGNVAIPPVFLPESPALFHVKCPSLDDENTYISTQLPSRAFLTLFGRILLEDAGMRGTDLALPALGRCRLTTSSAYESTGSQRLGQWHDSAL